MNQLLYVFFNKRRTWGESTDISPVSVIAICNYAILSVCLPFHINQLGMVNGIVLYIFTESGKYEGWKKTSSNTAPRHITTCCVQFNGAFVQQSYSKAKSRTVFIALSAHWNSFDTVEMPNVLCVVIIETFLLMKYSDKTCLKYCQKYSLHIF